MIGSTRELTPEEKISLRERIVNGLADFTNLDSSPLGTDSIVWTSRLSQKVCLFNINRSNEMPDVLFDEDNVARALSLTKYVEYFGTTYQKDFCSSIPNRLRIVKCAQPFHRGFSVIDPERGEYLYPVLYIFEGDIEHGKIKPGKLCVFCVGHKDSDTCTHFLSPSARRVRLRNINYTLMLLGISQICRSYGAVMHTSLSVTESSTALNAKEPGHNTALCNSAAHIVAMSCSTTQPAPDPAILETILEDDKAVKDEQHNKCMKARTDRVVLIKEEYNISIINPQMRTKQCYSYDEWKVSTHDKISERDRVLSLSIAAFDALYPELDCFLELLKKVNYYQEVVRYLDNYKELLCCSRFGCSSGLKSGYFCGCGKSGLCAPCLLGSDKMIYQKQDDNRTRCRFCSTPIYIPYCSGLDSCSEYFDVMQIICDLLTELKKDLKIWGNDSSLSPSLTTYKEIVSPVAHLMELQLRCRFCNIGMNTAERMVMKSTCNCGFLICLHCVQEKDGHTDCAKCRNDVSNFGVCLGLSAVACIARILCANCECEEDFRPPPKKVALTNGTVRENMASAQPTLQSAGVAENSNETANPQPNLLDESNVTMDDSDFFGDSIEKDPKDDIGLYFTPDKAKAQQNDGAVMADDGSEKMEEESDDVFDPITIGKAWDCNNLPQIRTLTHPLQMLRSESPNSGNNVQLLPWQRTLLTLCDIMDQCEINPNVVPNVEQVPTHLLRRHLPNFDELAARLYHFVDTYDRQLTHTASELDLLLAVVTLDGDENNQPNIAPIPDPTGNGNVNGTHPSISDTGRFVEREGLNAPAAQSQSENSMTGTQPSHSNASMSSHPRFALPRGRQRITGVSETESLRDKSAHIPSYAERQVQHGVVPSSIWKRPSSQTSSTHPSHSASNVSERSAVDSLQRSSRSMSRNSSRPLSSASNKEVSENSVVDSSLRNTRSRSRSKSRSSSRASNKNVSENSAVDSSQRRPGSRNRTSSRSTSSASNMISTEETAIGSAPQTSSHTSSSNGSSSHTSSSGANVTTGSSSLPLSSATGSPSHPSSSSTSVDMGVQTDPQRQSTFKKIYSAVLDRQRSSSSIGGTATEEVNTERSDYDERMKDRKKKEGNNDEGEKK